MQESTDCKSKEVAILLSGKEIVGVKDIALRVNKDEQKKLGITELSEYEISGVIDQIYLRN